MLDYYDLIAILAIISFLGAMFVLAKGRTVLWIMMVGLIAFIMVSFRDFVKTSAPSRDADVSTIPRELSQQHMMRTYEPLYQQCWSGGTCLHQSVVQIAPFEQIEDPFSHGLVIRDQQHSANKTTGGSYDA